MPANPTSGNGFTDRRGEHSAFGARARIRTEMNRILSAACLPVASRERW